MVTGTLYTPEKYHQTYRVLIAAKYSGVQLKQSALEDAPADKFPVDSAPLLQSGDLHLFGANAIAYYVGNKQLRGNEEEHLVTQWVSWADKHVLPAMGTLVYPCLGVTQFNKGESEKAKTSLAEHLKFLNNHLSTRTFLVGQRISQADITVFTVLLHIYEMVYDEAARDKVPHVTRWFNTLAHQSEFIAIVGPVKLCVKPAQFDAKKYAELHPKGDAGKKKDEGKAAKSPAQKPAGDDNEEPQKKPDKDPFAALPKGSFDMDEWKRTFSNNDIEKVALPWFWENFDKEHYSIWKCDYMYNDELSLVFMSCNLVGGMFQRLDRLRKHGFGSVIVFGENNNSTISGVWIWRGHDLAFTLHEDMQIDYESYKWTKLDANSPETKTVVNEYFSENGKFDGKKVAEGKIFK